MIRRRREGAFRDDVPVLWLLTVYFALVHAAGRRVATGASTASEAEQPLLPTLLGASARLTADNVLTDCDGGPSGTVRKTVELAGLIREETDHD